MQAEVKWVEDFKFLGTSQSGHSVVMDGNGGATAPSPMEMVLMAAGGCSSVDVVDGLKTAGQKVSSVNAKLSTERRETAPRIFTAVNIHFVVSGEQLDEAIVAKVTADSLEKYCSVCLMLGAGVEMTHSWEIV
ncbi:OsmC family protein [Vibrio vulnificus]|uniref:OsmC family protein n=1 Tax=Vibrio vulnificus TaxID=672 RepID=A0A1V8MSD2_VIBVL|nr:MULTISPECIES: OsmC family protein [Vibrio]EWS66802.1 osmotically inducible protein OsmC [Vibrio vulnificus BAA87]ASJ40532.1 osmotically inducible protein OsmC [Vibrio vulnificus]ASM99166.1 osmotically inducible protein OsmC [Vibrio vulnificus NBRC 15645 = ATCC 27562]AVX02151.1 osmotically inducible protein OsmC [Vibrio vulnificus Env1]EGQ7693625.1 OsmC family protein [Vibrio vulnificus]